MIRPLSRTFTCMMLSASLAIWTLAGETSFSQTQPEGDAPESPSIIREGTHPPEDQGEVIERGIIRDHRGQQKLLPPRQRTLPAPGTSSPIIRDHRTPSTPVPVPSDPSKGSGGPSSVVGGTVEPNYKYPWVVRMGGCGGVLIDPQWVLTAAHCVTPGIGFGSLTYSRTDPHTGAVKTETRAPAPVGSRRDGVFIHPDYNPTDNFANDIALIKLAQPFTINPYIQTVGLPKSPRRQGVMGTLASFSHTGQLPPGQLAIFRAPIPQVDYPPKIYITANAALASLCKGDSGSGFVTVENSRATVRGVASQGTITTCMTPSGEAVFTDVFTVRNWILQTMGKSDASLTGNTRVRWSGGGARGVMGIGCINPYGTLWGPLNVAGVEEGAVCEAGQTQTVMCNLEKNQGPVMAGMTPTITGFTMRTTMANGASEVRSLPFSGNNASFFGPLPAGATRDFTCQIGTPLTAPTTGTNATILRRGIEGEPPDSLPTGSEETPTGPK